MKILCLKCGEKIPSSVFHTWDKECPNCGSIRVLPLKQNLEWIRSQPSQAKA